MTGLRILFVTPYVPSPLRVRSYNFIRQLSRQGHRVTVATLCTPGEETAAAALRVECERVLTAPFGFGGAIWNCVRNAWMQAPLQALCTFSAVLGRRLATELGTTRGGNGHGAPYDLIHIEFLRAALFGLTVQGLPRVYDSVDCISRLLESTATLAGSPIARCAARIDLNATRRFEGRLIGEFEHTLATSDADRQALATLVEQSWQRLGGATRQQPQTPAAPAITVVPTGVDLQYFQPRHSVREAGTLVFVGRMSYHANVTAVLQFVHSVMPRIWAQRPDTRLLIVGSNPNRSVRRLARQYGPRVVVTGAVPDTRPFLARATVSVNPLVYAVGVQSKILEAMAMGTPVVVTPPASGSMRVQHGRHLLIAEDAVQFAQHVLHLFDDTALRVHLAENGRRYVEDHHDQRTVGVQLEDIYCRAIAQFRTHQSFAHQPLHRVARTGSV